MKNTIKNILMLSVLSSTLISISAAACSFFIGVHIIFKENTATLTAPDFDKLEKWAEIVQKNYPNYNGIEIHASAEQAEIDPERLARRRELAVRLALIDLDVTPAPIYTADKVVYRKGSFGAGPVSDVRRVDMFITPTCPYPCGNCPR